MTTIQIANAFSNGDFELTYPFLTEKSEWNVIGESHLKGKKLIVEKCNQTAAYFKSVVTIFKTLNIISDNKKVAINGTAEFIRNDKRVSFVCSCDVYEFDIEDKILTITSYCIQDQKS